MRTDTAQGLGVKDFVVEGDLKEGQTRNGRFGSNLNTTNVLAAMFMTCGRDARSLAEASWSHPMAECDWGTNDLRLALLFPSLGVLQREAQPLVPLSWETRGFESASCSDSADGQLMQRSEEGGVDQCDLSLSRMSSCLLRKCGSRGRSQVPRLTFLASRRHRGSLYQRLTHHNAEGVEVCLVSYRPSPKESYKGASYLEQTPGHPIPLPSSSTPLPHLFRQKTAAC